MKIKLVPSLLLLLLFTSFNLRAQIPPDVIITNDVYLWLVCSNYGSPSPLCTTNYIGMNQVTTTNALPAWCLNLGWEACSLPQNWLRYVITVNAFENVSNQVNVTGESTYRLCYTNASTGGAALLTELTYSNWDTRIGSQLYTLNLRTGVKTGVGASVYSLQFPTDFTHVPDTNYFGAWTREGAETNSVCIIRTFQNGTLIKTFVTKPPLAP